MPDGQADPDNWRSG